MRSKFFCCLAFVMLVSACNAIGSTVFLKAISTALSTMQFSIFPFGMTSGLAGAKLAVGAKLLYYLGYFGRQESPKVSPGGNFGQGTMKRHPTSNMGGFLPLPYSYTREMNAFPTWNGGLHAGNKLPLTDLLFPALMARGINPVQLIQALGSIGVDPELFLSSMGTVPHNIGTQGVDADLSKSRVPTPHPGDNVFQTSTEKVESDHNVVEGIPNNPEDIESFFAFLKDMDDNKCISRLVCDVGRDPAFLGDFTQNIASIVGSLEVPPESGANEYITIMEIGRTQGGCADRFLACTDEAYEIVKSVAPNVGVPSLSSANS